MLKLGCVDEESNAQKNPLSFKYVETKGIYHVDCTSQFFETNLQNLVWIKPNFALTMKRPKPLRATTRVATIARTSAIYWLGLRVVDRVKK